MPLYRGIVSKIYKAGRRNKYINVQGRLERVNLSQPLSDLERFLAKARLGVQNVPTYLDHSTGDICTALLVIFGSVD